MILRLFLLLAIFGSAISLNAQTDEDPFFRMVFSEEKRSVVSEFLDLTPEEADAFWPIYNQYEAERQAQGTVRLNLLEGYVEDYPDISDEEAEALVNAVLDLQTDMTKLSRKYFKKMKKATSARRATSWLQMEEYIMLAIRMEIYDEMPFLIEPND